MAVNVMLHNKGILDTAFNAVYIVHYIINLMMCVKTNT